MNLAKYSLDNTKIIYFFLAVLLIGGISSFGKLGKKEDAPFVIKSAVIMTRYPGAEPAEVERLITEPISREIQSMSGVYKIKIGIYVRAFQKSHLNCNRHYRQVPFRKSGTSYVGRYSIYNRSCRVVHLRRLCRTISAMYSVSITV